MKLCETATRFFIFFIFLGLGLTVSSGSIYCPPCTLEHISCSGFLRFAGLSDSEPLASARGEAQMTSR